MRGGVEPILKETEIATVQRFDIGVPTDRTTWKDLDEIGAGAPRRDHFGRSQPARKNRDIGSSIRTCRVAAANG